MSAYGFTSAEHTVRCGAALGAAIGAGLDVAPVLDDEGNYTAAFDIAVADGFVIRVVVQ